MRKSRMIATVITGRITRKTAASSRFIKNAIIIAPISMPGARSIIRSAIMIRFCTCVISLVRRVTREPVENRSISENEKVWIFLNASFRSPAPKLIAATDANHAPPTPPAIMMSAVRIMIMPFCTM